MVADGCCRWLRSGPSAEDVHLCSPINTSCPARQVYGTFCAACLHDVKHNAHVAGGQEGPCSATRTAGPNRQQLFCQGGCRWCVCCCIMPSASAAAHTPASTVSKKLLFSSVSSHLLSVVEHTLHSWGCGAACSATAGHLKDGCCWRVRPACILTNGCAAAYSSAAAVFCYRVMVDLPSCCVLPSLISSRSLRQTR
jgi:hypothetical protein